MKVAIRVIFVVLLFCDFVVWLIANIANKQRANKQHPTNNKICLEDSTERSESNPGRKSRDYKNEKSDCLEDSTKLIAFTLQYHSYYLLIS